MKIYINGEKEVNGYLKRIDNSFKIIVEDEIKENYFDFAYVYSDEYGIVTCVYCRFIAGKMSEKVKTKEFICEEALIGKVNPSEISIKQISLHFKEMDAFFVSNQSQIEYIFDEDDKKWILKQELINKDLYKNNKLHISYNNEPHYYHNEYGENIFNNYYWINIEFNDSINFNEIHSYISKIESCGSFLLKKKMNLIDLRMICDNDKKVKIYDIIKKNMISYDKIKREELHVVDISSLNILKSIIKRYFENDIYMACINTFYEYIYNKLDMSFEFISLINILEMFSMCERHKKKLEDYSHKNDELKKNKERLNNIYNQIEDVISIEDMDFLMELTNKNSITLNDKLNYFLHMVYSFEENDKSKTLIKKIKNTRKFFVHGSVKKDILEGVNLFLTKELFKDMLYMELIKEVTDDENIYIRTSKMTIQTLYDNIINNF